MKKLAIVAVLVSLAGFAQAQIPTSGSIFIGYSYAAGEVFAHASGFGTISHSTGMNGWEGSVEGKLLPWVGIVADLGQTFGSHAVAACVGSLVAPQCSNLNLDSKRFTALFGPRVSVSIGKFTPFAHALVGVGHVSDTASGFSDSDTSLATAVGGGLDYKLIKGLAWRLQGDELHTRFFGAGQNNFRFSTGIVFRF